MSTHPVTGSFNPPLGGTSGDLRGRLFRFHVPLAIASFVLLALFTTLRPFDVTRDPPSDLSGRFPRLISAPTHESVDHGRDQSGEVLHSGSADPGAADSGGHDEGEEASHARMTRLTFSTGYIAVVLLGLTLLFGPANLLLGRQNPVSTYLRRDVGMWAAAFSGAHVVLAVLAHADGGAVRAFLHFFVRDRRVLTDSYGLANWAGLAALVILSGLLAISSDTALRVLKSRTWKWLQRLNYAVFACAVLHVFFYGALLRISLFRLLLTCTVIAVLTAQAAGVLLWRAKHGAAR